VTQHPVPRSVCSGGSTNFTVAATGGTPLSYQWKRNGTNVPGATSATYNLTNVQVAQAGTYTCLVTNGCGTALSNGADLTVTASPAITQQPPPALAVEPDGQAVMSVTATGASLSYQWKRNGVNVTNGGPISGATGPTLTINPVSPPTHDGTYTVVVSNTCGNVISAPTLLCYGNCDLATTPPVLNVADFTCFLQQYATGTSYANCDGSTAAPVLNVADFTCFLQRYAAGCQ
jgi:hypothetical protein